MRAARTLTVHVRAPRTRVFGGSGVGVSRWVSVARCSPPALAFVSPQAFRRKGLATEQPCVTRSDQRGSAHMRMARVTPNSWLTGVACRALSNTPSDANDTDDQAAFDDEDYDYNVESSYDEDDDEDDFDASSIPFAFANDSGDKIGVDVLVVDENGGPPVSGDEMQIETLANVLEHDARFVIQTLLELSTGTSDRNDTNDMEDTEDTNLLKELALRVFPDELDVTYVELSVALCTDSHIKSLNSEWRDKNAATDVLSFPAETFGDVVVLGDVVVSVDTAVRQAREMRHGVLHELRVLLVHGIVHLLGMDHERSAAEAEQMSRVETALLRLLVRREIDDSSSDATILHGLIASAASGERGETYFGVGASADDGDSSSGIGSENESEPVAFPSVIDFDCPQYSTRSCDFLAIDLDGTLLNREGVVSVEVANALKEAAMKGVLICVATGKARPAARRALSTANLDGPGLVTGDTSLGIFLNGMDVRGTGGMSLVSATLDNDVVRDVFAFQGEKGGKASHEQLPSNDSTALTAFCGEECFTVGTETHVLLRELTAKFHEPSSVAWKDVDVLLRAANAARGGNLEDESGKGKQSENLSGVSKLLLMAETAEVIDSLRHQLEKVVGTRATVTQAVPTMLEVLPKGHDKTTGFLTLLKSLKSNAKGDQKNIKIRVVAIGDGENDAGLLRAATVGVAMGNACAVTRGAADHVLDLTNDENGVADAIRKFVL